MGVFPSSCHITKYFVIISQMLQALTLNCSEQRVKALHSWGLFGLSYAHPGVRLSNVCST